MKEKFIPAENPENFDRDKWEKLKKVGAFSAIKEGAKLGVSQEELDKYAQEVIDRETRNGEYAFVYRFRKSLGLGTPEERQTSAEFAYYFYYNDGEYGQAMALAEEIYGRDSSEYQRAKQAVFEHEVLPESEAKLDFTILLSKDATFRDLLGEIDSLEIRTGQRRDDDEVDAFGHFWAKVDGNFDKSTYTEARDLEAKLEKLTSKVNSNSVMTDEETALENTKVLEYFIRAGYTQAEIEAALPIKFRK